MAAIRYGYFQGLRLPAPFVNVTLRNLPGDAELADQPAQVDTGADRTVLPMAAVDALGLLPVDEISIAGIGGLQHVVRTFAVHLAVHDLPAVLVEVMAHADEPWILLGRDILNAHRNLLDGPQSFLEIG
jgi:predicted aspartyl protease